MINTPICCEDGRRQALLNAAAQLIECCPIGRKNPERCPLYSVRKRRHATRINWLKGLDTEDLEFIAEYHRVCLEWQQAGCP